MADGYAPFRPKPGNTPAERMSALAHFDNLIGAQVEHFRRAQKISISLEEKLRRLNVREMILKGKREQLITLYEEEGRISIQVNDPQHVRSLIQKNLTALHAEQQQIAKEMRAIEKDRGFFDRILKHPFPRKYDILADDFFCLKQKIEALNKQLDHPDVVHAESLRHLAAVRKKIADLKKDIEYQSEEIADDRKKLAA